MNIRELNRIILGVSDLTTKKGALTKNVIEHCSNVVLSGTIFNHQETIDFCMDIGLLRRRNDRILITEFGNEFLSYNKERNYALNGKQKNLLVLKCFLKGRLSGEVKKILRQFRPDLKRKKFVWSKSDSIRLDADREVLNLLYQLEVVYKSNDIMMINPQYSRQVSSFQILPGGMTREEFQQKQEEKDQVGSIAEEIVVNNEKKRLLSSSFKMESERVQNISDLKVDAGYDIVSFDGEGLDYDRFIEVKGSRYPDLFFIWSRNEIKVARELGKKYWIYFVGGIDLDTESTSQEPLCIQDPVNTILNSDDYKKDTQEVLVRKHS